ncbi:MAG: FmdB family zinc ribbon protein [Anaerolineae bacterium]
MPTYEYECETCGIHFEKLQRFSEEPLRVCPECQGPVHRVLYPAGIVFKGSGWYCTDHRSSSTGGNSNGGSTKDKSATGSTEGKTETKPEAKAERKAESKEAQPAN